MTTDHIYTIQETNCCTGSWQLMLVVKEKECYLLFYHQLMHLTAHKSHQRWVVFRGGGWSLYFYRDRNDHQLSGSFYVSGILPSMVLASPVCVRALPFGSKNWRCLCLTIHRCYSEVLLCTHVLRMIFLHSVEKCKNLQSLRASEVRTTNERTRCYFCIINLLLHDRRRIM